MRRAVIEAAHFRHQSDFAAMPREAGVENVLDTNMKETATRGRFASVAKSGMAWANADRPWQIDDFFPSSVRETADKIADFAIARRVDAVQSPTRSPVPRIRAGAAGGRANQRY